MKKTILGILCFFVSFSAFSQSDDSYNYSIALRGYSLMQMPKVLNQTEAQSYTHAYLNGIMVKFNDNQISYRLRANYFRKDISFNNQCSTCEIAEGKLTDYSFTIGFEKAFNYAKVQPYFGTDVGFRSNNFGGEVRNANPKSTNSPYNVTADKSGFMVAPLIGLRINPISQISIFAESALDFYYSYERQETTQQDAANTRSFSKFNKWEFLLNPVTIGIQIHLVQRN
jgi:hypothetical protein